MQKEVHNVSICTECIHEEKYWDRLTYYDSSCKVEHRPHPVTGQRYITSKGVCKDKNSDGTCIDFVQRDWTGNGCLRCLITIIVFIVTISLISLIAHI